MITDDGNDPGPLGTNIVTTPSAALADLQPALEAARAYAANSRAPSTQRVYRRCWRLFQEWCSAHSMSSLPAPPELVAAFLATQAAQASVSALAQALAAIAHAHQSAGLPSPHVAPVVQRVWAGIRRQKGVAPKRRAAPLGPGELRSIIGAMGPAIDLAAVRDRALLLVGFAAALRRHEVVDLDVSSLEFEADGLRVEVKRSKTDQEAHGETVGVPFGSDRVTCPVRAMRDWLDFSGLREGAVFRGVRYGRLTAKRLTPRDIARVIQRRARRAGLSVEGLSGHSLRAGLATTAAKAGKSMHSIAKQTRHKSLTMVERYIRDAELLGDGNAAGGIGL